MNPIIYITQRTVIAADIDEMNHVNNVVYLEYLQDLAAEHWSKNAPEDFIDSVKWVVRKHEIEYLRPAVLGDQLTLKTWVESFSGVISIRCYEMWLNDKIIVRAKTEWVAVDAETHRPKRINNEELIHSFFQE